MRLIELCICSVEEMAMTAMYLAASEYTNGASVLVDGGLALMNP